MSSITYYLFIFDFFGSLSESFASVYRFEPLQKTEKVKGLLLRTPAKDVITGPAS